MAQRHKKIIFRISSSLKELRKVEKETQSVAQRFELNPEERENLAIAVTEAVGNAIIHGNKKDPKKEVQITFQSEPDQIIVQVQDEGKGFDPKEIRNPLLPQNLMKENGRGIFILKTIMDEVTFSFTQHGTITKMVMKKTIK